MATQLDDEVALTPLQQQIIARWPGMEDFEPVVPPPNPRLIIGVWGGDKVGKTSLGLTFPPPIVDINFDFGIDELMFSRPDMQGQVFKHSLLLNENLDPESLVDLFDEFHDKYLRAVELADKYSGTLMLDTATQLWQIVQEIFVTQVRQKRIADAEAKSYDNATKRRESIERASKPMQLDYGTANLKMSGLLRRPLHSSRANAIFINKAKPEYNDSGKPTGAMEYHGFGDMHSIAQAMFQLYKKREGNKLVHYARFTSCRFDTSLEGIDIPNPTYQILRGMMLGS